MMGIALVGANGSGKTTLGSALSKEINYKHMDIEDYYFVDSEIPYAVSRTREEVEILIQNDISYPCSQPRLPLSMGRKN